ncbi:hypothetical protein OGAPHI_002779 [Ogataea philodendri]|uniref:Uncharacterized protein n=1 Tax=Ogataea philodendri TaxID=1378263 RepID=A0A9P8T6I5_9ASCO|nr:uncharacterized protein OGAPHI_002779 [Ogataea philodendri]KAH3667130.1 hypothetical protein OGAPHI_002779 [Ogataea philodendri]
MDLLFDQNLESLRANKQRRSRSRRVVHDGSDIGVLDLVEWVQSVDSVFKDLVENKADSGTSAQLVRRDVFGLTVQNSSVVVAEVGDHAEHDRARRLCHLRPQSSEFLLVFLQCGLDSGLDLWQSCSDMVEQNGVQLLGQVWRTAVVSLAAIGWVVLEESSFVVQSLSDGLVVLNILLSSINDRDVSGPQWDDSACQNVNNVGSLVHQIDLGQNTNGSESFRVDLSGQLQTVTIGQILIGSIDGQNDRVWFRNELHDHLTNLFLNILRLVSNRNFGQSRQINKRQGQNVWRIDPQIDRNRANTRVFSRLCFGLSHDLLTDVVKVVELLAR